MNSFQKKCKHLAIFVGFVGWYLSEGIKNALDDRMHKHVVGTCTRPAPHRCGVSGPCNGWMRR